MTYRETPKPGCENDKLDLNKSSFLRIIDKQNEEDMSSHKK